MNQPWEDRFEALLEAQLGPVAGTGLTADDDLFEKGLDSVGVVALVVAAEETYGIVFPDEALDRETFRTPGSLWATICGLLSPVPDGGGNG
ncbi:MULTISPECIES: phosphopantetheine-binding protein [Streptomyces]|uniref:Phosphopantetheine-binding protein n=1 Tax=Streptomyces heliomycini TaxID=284032 RepID=A0ABV5L5N9_9ACTN|nr:MULTISPECIES: phosphopantetheine-binding protein [Streptomyces]